MNILEATPKIKPSVLCSMAGDTMAFENPVIGIAAPAPPIFPILS